MVKAVLFDMDGTLTDTEKYYNHAFVTAMHEAGYLDYRSKDALFHRSLNHTDAAKHYRKKYGPSFPYEKIHERSNALVLSRLKKDGIPLKPGIREITTWLRSHHILAAVVTATKGPVAEERLRSAGIRDLFSSVISAHDVRRGKPYPDPYLYAIKELQERDPIVTPASSIAVEDSPNGIKSAVSAGIRTIMIPDLTGPDEDLSKILYAVVPSLDQLIPVLSVS